MRRDVDVVVVGAGPAGALTAREIARGGASVLLLDRKGFPRRKVCGACLSAGAVSVLDAVGLGGLAPGLGAVPLQAIVLSARGRVARLPLQGGRALSRRAFDEALVRAAVDAGVELWSGAHGVLEDDACDRRVVRVTTDGRETSVSATLVVDATGLGSGLAVDGAPRPSVDPRSRVGLGATFADAVYPVSAGDLHMAVGRGGYVGVVRVESGALHVAAAVDPDELRGSTPEAVVAGVLASAGLPPLPRDRIDDWRGTPSLTRAPADVGGRRLLRVGDAAGYVEPFTGEGMCWALSGAVALAPLALAATDGWHEGILDEWRAYHAAALGRARRLCRILVPALRRPRLVSAALAVLAVAPVVASPLVRRAARAPTTDPVWST